MCWSQLLDADWLIICGRSNLVSGLENGKNKLNPVFPLGLRLLGGGGGGEKAFI